MKDSKRMKEETLYLFPGIMKEYPVFERLIPLLSMRTEMVVYPKPWPRESLVAFAGRVAKEIPAGALLAGISLGGMIAQEVSQVIESRGCVVIASIRGPEQMPPRMRIGRMLGSENCRRLLAGMGNLAALVPGVIRPKLLARAAMLAGDSGAWECWASGAVVGWTPSPPKNIPTLQIHGDADRTFPVRYVKADVVVRDGRHALTVSHPEEVSQVMEKFLRGVTGGD